MALDPSREGSEGPAGRSDYSETHFSANALGKTTPKRVFLPKKPRTHLVPCLALPTRQGGRSSWMTTIGRGRCGPWGPRLTFRPSELGADGLGQNSMRESWPKEEAQPASGQRPLACAPPLPPTPRFPVPPRSGRVRRGWRCAGGRLARRRHNRCTRWRACGRA